MKFKIKVFMILISLVALSWAQMAGEPCNAPPFLSQKVNPNILVIMDNSGSMNGAAYKDNYNPSRRYYGYFDPGKVYSFNNGTWEPVNQAPNYYTYWPGNLLNWAFMSRMSILKKVLVGGKALARSVRGLAHTLVIEGGSWTKYFSWGGYNYTIQVNLAGQGGQSFSIRRGNSIVVSGNKNQVEIDSTFSRGVIQKLGDRDMDGRWDDDAARFWLINFNNKTANGREMNAQGNRVSVSSDHDGGYVSSYYQDNSSMSDFVNTIQNVVAKTWTPLAECLLETVWYFRQVPTPLFFNNDYKTGGRWDPMYDANSGDNTTYWCRKSFVLLLTDGEATRDRDFVLQQYIGDYDGDGKEPGYIDGSVDPYNSHYLDDVAYYMHINDLRPDIPSVQNLTLYGVYLFGRGGQLLMEACKKGAFTDYNGNRIPDLPREWDADGNGIPDTYYEAEDGEELERSIMAVILDIMRRVSSATSASVVSQTQKGEGTIVQAFFQPTLPTSLGDISWIGNVVSYFVDKNGNIREDSDGDKRLTDSDRAIKFRLDENEVVAERWSVVNDELIYKVDEVGLWEISHLWSGGRSLLNKSANQRNIKAIIKQGADYSLIDFTKTNRGLLSPYLEGMDAFKDSLIDYVRGIDYNNPDWRFRTYESGKVWKLGDIVYSTPTYVGRPTERYDLIYDDVSYREFYNRKKDRRNIVLVGANDGMLHAFNAGLFDADNRRVNGLGKELGDELWAVIPMNLISHLKWLKDPRYCHVYYVDLKPKVTDVKIFNPDNDHPEGWGTVAIVGMRLGGTPITVGANTYRSSYFALDISDPDNPRVLWEFTDSDLGYTISYPTVLKVVGDNNQEKWFVVFGSGTTTTPTGGSSTKPAYVYILDLRTGQLLRKIQIPYPENGTQGAFCGNPISVDVRLDYSVDVIYLPTTYVVKQGNTTVDKGALYRIVTQNSINPNDWQLSMAFRLDRPLTSGAAASMDEYGNLWVFFGSGKYFSDADELDNANHYFIGFRDAYWNGGWTSSTNPSYSFSDLLDATNIKVRVDTSGAATVQNAPWNNLSFDAFVDSVNARYKGWYVKLSSGEKSLNFPLVLGGMVLFTSYKVNYDPCGFGGTGWLYVLFYKTGTASSKASLGLNLQREAITKIQVEGMPASPAVQIGAREEATAFVQTATGEIVRIETELHYTPKSGSRIWRPGNF